MVLFTDCLLMLVIAETEMRVALLATRPELTHELVGASMKIAVYYSSLSGLGNTN